MSDAFRMVLSYSSDGTISLVHGYRADLAMPMNASLPDSPGHHLVGRDSDGNELFRIGARGLFLDVLEVFDRDGRVSNVPAPLDGTFMTVLPYHESLEHVAIVKVEHDAIPVDLDIRRALLTPQTVETELVRFMDIPR